MKEGAKVFVGISGGVDSSVALFLLKEAGYEVTGVYLRTWQPEWMECTWRDERRDAMRVCAHLAVPFLEYDVSEAYKNKVAEYMINEYKAGRTPNPDIMCNKEIKFGEFFDFAMSRGADYVATGHYARTENGQLLKGKDESKDQSYFLWSLSKGVLEKTLFPLGKMMKKDVRKIAKQAGLPTAMKKDSQGICFIGDIGMKDFLSHYVDAKVGNVINVQDEIIGTHDGAYFYTIGERHGFTITKKTPNDPVLYVISKDIDRNTIMVGENIVETSSVAREIILSGCVARDVLEENTAYEAQFRYHGKLHPCKVLQKGDGLVLSFKESDLVAKGQSCVLYRGDICIGGGVVI
jgi:tRNA-specific 2-thiouridylase